MTYPVYDALVYSTHATKHCIDCLTMLQPQPLIAFALQLTDLQPKWGNRIYEHVYTGNYDDRQFSTLTVSELVPAPHRQLYTIGTYNIT